MNRRDFLKACLGALAALAVRGIAPKTTSTGESPYIFGDGLDDSGWVWWGGYARR